jgi:hypothetical protein
MKMSNGAVLAILAGFVLGGVSGCEREGPAERAGEAIDEAIEDAGEAIEDAGEAIEDKQEEVEDAIQEEK